MTAAALASKGGGSVQSRNTRIRHKIMSLHMFVTLTQPHWSAGIKGILLTARRRAPYLDQLSPALAVRADTVDDLGQVDSSDQAIVGHEGSDSHQVVIATGWIHLFRQSLSYDSVKYIAEQNKLKFHI